MTDKSTYYGYFSTGFISTSLYAIIALFFLIIPLAAEIEKIQHDENNDFLTAWNSTPIRASRVNAFAWSFHFDYEQTPPVIERKSELLNQENWQTWGDFPESDDYSTPRVAYHRLWLWTKTANQWILKAAELGPTSPIWKEISRLSRFSIAEFYFDDNSNPLILGIDASGNHWLRRGDMTGDGSAVVWNEPFQVPESEYKRFLDKQQNTKPEIYNVFDLREPVSFLSLGINANGSDVTFRYRIAENSQSPYGAWSRFIRDESIQLDNQGQFLQYQIIINDIDSQLPGNPPTVAVSYRTDEENITNQVKHSGGSGSGSAGHNTRSLTDNPAKSTESNNDQNNSPASNNQKENHDDSESPTHPSASNNPNPVNSNQNQETANHNNTTDNSTKPPNLQEQSGPEQSDSNKAVESEPKQDQNGQQKPQQQESLPEPINENQPGAQDQEADRQDEQDKNNTNEPDHPDVENPKADKEQQAPPSDNNRPPDSPDSTPTDTSENQQNAQPPTPLSQNDHTKPAPNPGNNKQPEPQTGNMPGSNPGGSGSVNSPSKQNSSILETNIPNDEEQIPPEQNSPEGMDSENSPQTNIPESSAGDGDYPARGAGEPSQYGEMVGSSLSGNGGSGGSARSNINTATPSEEPSAVGKSRIGDLGNYEILQRNWGLWWLLVLLLIATLVYLYFRNRNKPAILPAASDNEENLFFASDNSLEEWEHQWILKDHVQSVILDEKQIGFLVDGKTFFVGSINELLKKDSSKESNISVKKYQLDHYYESPKIELNKSKLLIAELDERGNEQLYLYLLSNPEKTIKGKRLNGWKKYLQSIDDFWSFGGMLWLIGPDAENERRSKKLVRGTFSKNGIAHWRMESPDDLKEASLITASRSLEPIIAGMPKHDEHTLWFYSQNHKGYWRPFSKMSFQGEQAFLFSEPKNIALVEFNQNGDHTFYFLPREDSGKIVGKGSHTLNVPQRGEILNITKNENQLYAVLRNNQTYICKAFISSLIRNTK